MELNGTIINYYFFCKRRCWLHYNKINMEQLSEDVKIGKILHELRYNNKINSHIFIDGVEIDSINTKFIEEFKKSNKNTIGSKYQLLFYLKKLYSKGIEKDGKIVFKENKGNINIKFDKEMFNELEIKEFEIKEFLKGKIPPIDKKINGCKRCSFFEFCHN